MVVGVASFSLSVLSRMKVVVGVASFSLSVLNVQGW